MFETMRMAMVNSDREWKIAKVLGVCLCPPETMYGMSGHIRRGYVERAVRRMPVEGAARAYRRAEP